MTDNATSRLQMHCAIIKTLTFPRSASHYAQRCKLHWSTYCAASASPPPEWLGTRVEKRPALTPLAPCPRGQPARCHIGEGSWLGNSPPLLLLQVP